MPEPGTRGEQVKAHRRSRRWRAALAAAAVIALGVTAGTGLIVQTTVEEQQARIAETAALTESVDLDASQLDAHAGILTARATQAAEQALSGAEAAIAEANGKSDAAALAASVSALKSFELLAPERVFALVEETEAHVATVRAGIAEFDRIAAERAAAERAAAERAAAEAAAAERAAAEAADAAAQPKPGSRGSPSTPAPPSNPSEAQAIARDVMASQYGWGDDQFGCLVALWNYESGWNVYASNPSGAYGIPQALPGSKMATAGADWQTSARTQIIWGLGYISGRYGTPCGAWGHVEANGWY
ncbi:lytic transglycosylase domain-containing protein [Agromyces ramosus]|uniref:Lytic transglycosylase domain-containing protein n=1 Tax=Agromyces ramosus TaxID=33879 RepID=A0ABU0RCN3_9MICO|nr:lytic transglycosylase domain-containing protein [Agromyces ramosus]MDQ0895813.1 hypothetical protein [Agromyces ramosus]